MAVAILLVQVDTDLYLLAAALGLLGLASWRSAISHNKSSCSLELARGKAVLSAATFAVALAASVPFSTMLSVSGWFAWIIGSQLLVYLLWRQAASEQGWAQVFWPLCAVIASAAIWAVVEFFFKGGRSNGPFQDFNAFGALVYLLLIPAVGVVLTAGGTERWQRLLQWALIALGSFALFATMSRGATAVALVAGVAVLACAKRAGASIRRSGLAVVGIAAASYVTVKLFQSEPGFRTLALDADPSTRGRVLMWKSAWQAYLDHPLMGTGLGTYRLQYLHYRLPEEVGTTGDLAHNDYLQILMEGGPILLGLLLAWGGFCLWLTYRLWIKAGDPALASSQRLKMAEAFALAISVLGLFAHALVNFIFYVLPLSMLAGLYVAQAHVTLGAPGTRTFRIPVGRGVANFVAGTAGLLIVGGLLVDWAGSMAFDGKVQWRALVEMRADPVRRFNTASAFLAVRRRHVPAHQAATSAAMDLALKDRDSPIGQIWGSIALEQGKAWLAASQGNPFVYFTMGQLLWHFPSLAPRMGPEFADRPDAILEKAIDRYPAYPNSYRVLAEFQLAQGRTEAALITLQRALVWARISVASEEVLMDWSKLIDEGVALATQLPKDNHDPAARRAADEFLSIKISASP